MRGFALWRIFEFTYDSILILSGLKSLDFSQLFLFGL